MDAVRMNSGILAVHGIGPAAEKSLSQAGIATVADLLNVLPRSYNDFTTCTPLSAAESGREGFFHVTATSAPAQYTGRTGVPVIRFTVKDEDGSSASVTLFHQPYMMRRLRSGSELFLYGTPEYAGGFLHFTAPKVMTKPPDTPLAAVYPVLGGLSSGKVRHAVRCALDAVDIDEPHTRTFLERYDLLDLRAAYHAIHLPETLEDPEKGQKRLMADQCFVLARALDDMAARRATVNQTPVQATGMIGDFLRRLPFEPTGAQRKAMEEIARDLEGTHAMNRLLQGDVGSGKTAVALFAAYAVMRGGYQAVLLAPTEVLARQHCTVAQSILPPERVYLLTGQTTDVQRSRLRAFMGRNSGTLLIGTHALLYEDLGLQSAALLITDEQHRFGVRQRQTLLSEYDGIHSLTMSATPIPRSLALATHGQTNVSILNERPPGRTPVKTSYVPSAKVDAMFEFMASRAAAGTQSYIVCAAIEPSDAVQVRSAKEMHETLCKRFPGVRFGLLHGRCSTDEKNRVMRDFSAGDIDILITTTVIEVGVDVPNATVMAVLDADRFGLAQLHQLRGRVGRGAKESYCFLATTSRDAMRRIRVLCSTDDGFRIAEEDLKERGAGDFLGDRQHGKQSALSLLTLDNEQRLEQLRNELRDMSTDPLLYQDYAYFTKQAEHELTSSLAGLALN